jgi:hypothetical protein
MRELWDRGLLYEGHRVTPYCARCGTGLSSHELGQPDAYRVVVDLSAYVRFPMIECCHHIALLPGPSCGAAGRHEDPIGIDAAWSDSWSALESRFACRREVVAGSMRGMRRGTVTTVHIGATNGHRLGTFGPLNLLFAAPASHR